MHETQILQQKYFTSNWRVTMLFDPNFECDTVLKKEI